VIKDNISSSANKKVEWTDEYVDKHWQEIGMGTHSADLNDDERLYEAAARFYDEKKHFIDLNILLDYIQKIKFQVIDPN